MTAPAERRPVRSNQTALCKRSQFGTADNEVIQSIAELVVSRMMLHCLQFRRIALRMYEFFLWRRCQHA